MKTLPLMAAVIIAAPIAGIIWIRRRRDHRTLVEAVGKVGGWWEEELPG